MSATPTWLQRLQAAAEAKHLGPRALGRALGTSHTFARQLMRGERLMAPSQLQQLLRLLDLPADEAAVLERALVEHLSSHGGSQATKDLAARLLEALPARSGGEG